MRLDPPEVTDMRLDFPISLDFDTAFPHESTNEALNKFEEKAFIRDLVVLGPVYLKREPQTYYTVIMMSAPTVKGENWDRWIR